MGRSLLTRKLLTQRRKGGAHLSMNLDSRIHNDFADFILVHNLCPLLMRKRRDETEFLLCVSAP